MRSFSRGHTLNARFAAFSLVVTFFALERFLRRGAAAQSLTAGKADRTTTIQLAGAYVLTLLTSLIAVSSPVGRLPRWRVVETTGLITMIAGLLLKAWAMRTLGRFYTRTLRVEADQWVVRSGPYRLIRHPGYLGALLVWIGFGLALASGLLTAVAAVSLGFAYRRRIVIEEALLSEQLGDDYRTYCRHTWRLLPPVY